MKKITQFLVVALVLLASVSHAQKMKVQKGDFKFLKGQKDVNVEFVYDNMSLFKDNKTNEEYMEERSKELNKKSKGKGDRWAKKWTSSREMIWEPKFMDLITRNKKISFQQGNTDAKYTLIVETVWIYPGWNAGVMRKPAKVTTELRFVETANRDKVKLKISAKNAPGDSYGGSYSNEDRIGEGYAKTGKTLNKMISKKAK